MRTTLDIIDILWGKLNSSPLKTAISGGIFKGARPANSAKEDVVIRPLPINNAQLQVGIVNVNVHVPNLSVKVNEVQDNLQPNHQRLKTLAQIACDALKDTSGSDYYYDVQQQNVFEEPESRSHFVNIRVQFYSINLSN